MLFKDPNAHNRSTTERAKPTQIGKQNSKRAQIQKKVTSMWPFYNCGCSCRPLRISQARLLVLVWTPMHLREKSAIPQLAKTCDEHISQKRTLSWVTSANLCFRAETLCHVKLRYFEGPRYKWVWEKDETRKGILKSGGWTTRRKKHDIVIWDRRNSSRSENRICF